MRLPDFALLSGESPRFLPWTSFLKLKNIENTHNRRSKTICNAVFEISMFVGTFDIIVNLINMADQTKELGKLILSQRMKFGYSQKFVAQKLGIDISLLCKIEHGERKVQSRMLKEISTLFDLNYEKLQIEYLSRKLLNEFSNEPFIIDAMENCISSLNKVKIKS